MVCYTQVQNTLPSYLSEFILAVHGNVGMIKFRKFFAHFWIYNEKCDLHQNIALGAYPNYSITNPPLLAFALMQAVQMNDNSLFSNHYYPIQKYEKYLEETHNDQGLFKWLHSYESGIDDRPRFTNQSESEHYDLSHLWAIDFNVWMILHYRTMNQIAIQIGKTQDAEYYWEK